MDEDAIIIQYHEATIKRLEKRIDELMAQPAQEPVAWQFMNGSTFRMRRPKDFSDLAPDGFPYWKPVYTTPPQQERNFCPRCGKRTADLTTIHTCTPPPLQEKHT